MLPFTKQTIPGRVGRWTQNNEGGNSNLFRTTHTTAGPSAGFSFSFYGSRGVAILGKRDSNAVPAVTLNGRSYGLSGQQEPVLFSTEGLDPNVAYTLEMRYTGVSFLNVAALYLDQNGMVGYVLRETCPHAPANCSCPALQHSSTRSRSHAGTQARTRSETDRSCHFFSTADHRPTVCSTNSVASNVNNHNNAVRARPYRAS